MNIPEILVANGTGAVLVSFLLLLRVRGESKNSVGTALFCRMLVVTLLAQVTETISFLLDGVPGAASRFWLYLTNTVCTGATVCVGYAWCLYVDFRVYRSTGRLRKRHLLLGAPLLALLVLLVANLFGTGWIFSISADNVYHRGPLNILLYLLLFGYYAESVLQVHKAKRDGITVEFFPVYYFVVTCAVGTVLQGVFYGMAFGWLSVAIAFVFVDSQTRSLRGYTDELSGLFGRKYMNYCLDRIHATQEKDVYGIMMDVNCFKEINDTYGHAEGDRAIQEIGHILSGALAANSVAIRMSGDEFMVLIRHGSEELLDKICAAIEQRVQHYNTTAPAGSFQLSFSTGVAKYEGGSVEKFLVELDQRMYAEKRAFHAARDGHAAPEQGECSINLKGMSKISATYLDNLTLQ